MIKRSVKSFLREKKRKQSRKQEVLYRRVFLVQAHPVACSFSSAIANTVESSLLSSTANSGVEVRRRNLYKMPDGKCFQPILDENERLNYFEENRQPQIQVGGYDTHVPEIVDSLRWCDGLVLIYPTWWFNMPAMLKGFFDRCFVPGVGFRYDKATQKRTTGLQNIRRVGVITTYGFDEPTVSKAGDAGRKMIEGGMTMLMHAEVKVDWDALYSMQAAQAPEVREKFLAGVRSRYSNWS